MYEELVGKKFNRWLVDGLTHNGEQKLYHVWCICECGNEGFRRASAIVSGRSMSCGCLRDEKTQQRSTKHGHTKGGKPTKTFITWQNMWRRCTDPKDKSFPFYGAKGISVCERWSEFKNFLEDMGESNGLTIDRINTYGNYEPNNCRWATRKEQSRNSRSNRPITLDGETKLLSDWCSELSIEISAIHYWSKRDSVSFEEVLSRIKSGELILVSREEYLKGNFPDYSRQRISEKQKEVWKNPEYKKRASARVSGEKNEMAKITENEALAIYERVHSGEKNIDLAKEFGLAPATISNIKLGKTWSSVTQKS